MKEHGNRRSLRERGCPCHSQYVVIKNLRPECRNNRIPAGDFALCYYSNCLFTMEDWYNSSICQYQYRNKRHII